MKTQLIGAALGLGAQDHRTESGPESLRRMGLLEVLSQSGFHIGDFPILQSSGRASLMQALPLIAEFNKGLARLVSSHLQRNEFPIVLGGDHSVAVGTWSGVASAFRGEDLGLLWIDAHMDAHTPETTETGAVHGMPLAALLGLGDARLTDIEGAYAKFKPENVCLLGVRSYEKGEADLLRRLGVRVYFMDEIRDRGFATCFAEAHQRVTRRTSHFGVTLDLDAFDPGDFPAVGSPAEKGLLWGEVRTSLRLAARDTHLAAFELVEYNPALDEDRSSFVKIALLLEEILWARALGPSLPFWPPLWQGPAKHLIIQ